MMTSFHLKLILVRKNAVENLRQILFNNHSSRDRSYLQTIHLFPVIIWGKLAKTLKKNLLCGVDAHPVYVINKLLNDGAVSAATKGIWEH